MLNQRDENGLPEEVDVGKILSLCNDYV